jgi:hypothetical protein
MTSHGRKELEVKMVNDPKPPIDCSYHVATIRQTIEDFRG